MDLSHRIDLHSEVAGSSVDTTSPRSSGCRRPRALSGSGYHNRYRRTHGPQENENDLYILVLSVRAHGDRTVANAAPGTSYSTLEYPSGGGYNDGAVGRDGCSANTFAKSDRVQTIYTDWDSNNTNIVCEKVGVRAYYYAGTGSSWTAWDHDWDAATVFRSSYVSSQHSLKTIGAA